ncbi:MAG: ComF family protein [Sinobacterium sp.]|nr:ComF family protein [Sinobacterium sp.]
MVYYRNSVAPYSPPNALLHKAERYFHQHCASCHLPSLGQGFYCECCESDVLENTMHCIQCAEPFAAQASGVDEVICGQCLQQPPFFQKAYCPIIYNDAAKPLIEKIKSNDAGAIRYAAKLFSPVLREFLQHDIITAIPMSSTKLRQRHCNPSELLSIEVAKLAKRSRDPLVGGREGVLQPMPLQQVKHYSAQKGLNLEQRRGNVRGAFLLPEHFSEKVKGRSVLIIDDVMTSGSTLNEAAKVMHKLGAKAIHVAAVARTPKQLH